MARVNLYQITKDQERVLDSQGLSVPVYHQRVTALLWIGSSKHPYDGIIDIGSPLTIIPDLIWKNLQREIEWFTTPFATNLKPWCTSISRVTGGAFGCKLGRISLTVFDLNRNSLVPTRVVAKFAYDNGRLPNKIILGLWGGILENRRFVLDSLTGDTWLEE